MKIECSKAQHKRLISHLVRSGLINDECVLGKNYLTCPAMTNNSLTCKECLEKHIKRKEKSDDR